MNLVNIDSGATRAEGDGVGALLGLFAKFQLRHPIPNCTFENFF